VSSVHWNGDLTEMKLGLRKSFAADELLSPEYSFQGKKVSQKVEIDDDIKIGKVIGYGDHFCTLDGMILYD